MADGRSDFNIFQRKERRRMSRVHLCLGRLADNPYTFEKSRVRVFSIEELCFFLRENAYLLDENIFTRGFLTG